MNAFMGLVLQLRLPQRLDAARRLPVSLQNTASGEMRRAKVRDDAQLRLC